MAIENRGPQIAALVFFFLILSWIIVTLRFYVRIRIIKIFFLDDWLTACSLVRSTFPLLQILFLTQVDPTLSLLFPGYN